MSKTYLITGITGFAGPHLANLLVKRGHTVHGMVRSSNGREEDIRDVVPDKNMAQIKFVYGDLTSRESMMKLFKEEKYDGVFHLAAQSHPPTSFIDPVGTFNANANGTINLVTALIEHSPTTKLMLCSTSEVYGRVPGETKETQPMNPINPYGVSKAAADLYVRERAVSEGFPFFVTRAFSHTGPRRGKKFSISSDAFQIARIVKGLQEPKIQVGKLESKRVVMDVRDCDEAYIALMEGDFKSGEAYNVGGDTVYSMGELLDMMLELRGLKGKVELIRDEKLVRKIGFGIQIPDSTKLRQLTGWKPKIPIKQTLQDLLSYWEAKVSE
ncbi:MAG: GDP-mannose 4,6-dehydratase [Nanoarchaeota archaeon]